MRETNGPESLRLVLISSHGRHMYGASGAAVAAKAWPILRRYLSKVELGCDWLEFLARFFSSVRAENAGWQCKIDRWRQVYYYMFFMGIFWRCSVLW